jgi:release factor glutamine methyltransferase
MSNDVRFETRLGVLSLDCDGTMPPSPYTRLMADHMPPLSGARAIDVGTGSGALAIVARYQGAREVLLSDTNPAAAEVAVANGRRNGVESGLIALAPNSEPIPLATRDRVDVVICNPASLPMPWAARGAGDYFAGEDGRAMIERVVFGARERLTRRGRLLLVHTSLADLARTERLLNALRLDVSVLAQHALAFRPFYDRHWIDQLGGLERGLYRLVDDRPVEDIRLLEVRPRRPLWSAPPGIRNVALRAPQPSPIGS